MDRHAAHTLDDTKRDIARRVVVEEGGTYQEAADRSGLSIRTVERWASTEKWQQQRRDRCEYWDDVFKLKRTLLKRATDKPEPANVHAWSTVEGRWPEHRYASGVDPGKRREIAAQLAEQMVAHLGDTAPDVLAALEPHLDAIIARWEAAHGR